MTDKIDAILNHVPASLQKDAQRLFKISPLFTMLMRTATNEAWLSLFVDAEKALLPDESEEWIPPCESSDLVTCMRHLRQCKQRKR